MIENKKVKQVAEAIRMMNPNFSISQSYLAASAAIDKIKELELDPDFNNEIMEQP